jgi:hypothetical protein
MIATRSTAGSNAGPPSRGQGRRRLGRWCESAGGGPAATSVALGALKVGSGHIHRAPNLWRSAVVSRRSCAYVPLRIARLVRDAAGLTADNPAILWRYAGILSMRLSGFRTRPGAELHGAGRHRADTQARRAQEGPLTEAEHASSRPAATAAEAAGGESIRRDEHTPSAYQNTRTRGLNGRAQEAADHARRQHRWPHSSGVAAGANRQDRPDEVSGGRP